MNQEEEEDEKMNRYSVVLTTFGQNVNKWPQTNAPMSHLNA